MNIFKPKLFINMDICLFIYYLILKLAAPSRAKAPLSRSLSLRSYTYNSTSTITSTIMHLSIPLCISLSLYIYIYMYIYWVTGFSGKTPYWEPRGCEGWEKQPASSVSLGPTCGFPCWSGSWYHPWNRYHYYYYYYL